MSCEEESISTTTECRLIREPHRPRVDGSCPKDHERISSSFLVPVCLPIVPSSYQCLPKDPRLCVKQRPLMTTYAPLNLAYPSP